MENIRGLDITVGLEESFLPLNQQITGKLPDIWVLLYSVIFTTMSNTRKPTRL